MAQHQNIAEWHGKTLVDRDGQKIGKLQDVYVDVETDEPMFGTVKEGPDRPPPDFRAAGRAHVRPG
jgi:sporulation protein YlmC with PRC-barrel domain